MLKHEVNCPPILHHLIPKGVVLRWPSQVAICPFILQFCTDVILASIFRRNSEGEIVKALMRISFATKQAKCLYDKQRNPPLEINSSSWKNYENNSNNNDGDDDNNYHFYNNDNDSKILTNLIN